eukprot:5004195-Pyramimonas_sp.AAC.1
MACAELTGVREGACRSTHGMRRAGRGARGSMRVHTWLCGAVRGSRGSMYVHTWLSGADRGARGSLRGHTWHA